MVVLVVLCVLSANPALAQTSAPAPTTASGASNCSAYVGLTNHIAGCILTTVDGAARTFYKQFFPYLARAVAAVTLLGVVLYGVMLTAGMVDDVGKSTVLLFLKIGAVSFFVYNSDYMYDTVYGAMNNTAAEIVSIVPTTGNASGDANFDQITCLGNMTSAAQQSGTPITGPWLAIDCMLDTVIGIKVPNAAGGSSADASKATNPKFKLERSGVSRGLLYFFSSSLTTSVVGMIIGAIGLLFIWSLITLVIKSLLGYISGFLGVTFLIIISPLFIPLVLLPGEVPKQYFRKWCELMLGLALQPVLMLVFVIFFISAVDLAMFSGKYSIMYRIAGDASQQNGFNVNEYIAKNNGVEPKKPVKLWDVKTDRLSPTVTQNTGKTLVNGLFESKCGQEAMTGVALSAEDAKACANVSPVQTYKRSLDWDKLAAARQPPVVVDADTASASSGSAGSSGSGALTEEQKKGQQLSREVLASSIFCAVILLVLNRIASIVDKVILDLVGGMGQTPNLYSNATAISRPTVRKS